jgi:sugar phosphate isomerase/epimerase
MKGISRRARACVVVAVTGVAALGTSSAAEAQRPEKVGDGVNTGQMGVQMFNYGNYISAGGNTGSANPITSIAPASDGTQCFTSVPPNANANPPIVGDPPALLAQCRANRLEALFAFLQKKGVTNIELFGHAGFPADTDIPGLRAYRALMDKYGLHAGGQHGTMTDVGSQWTTRVAAAKILGMDYIGSGGVPSPGVTNTTGQQDGYAKTLRTAEAWNRLGKEAVEAGVGPAYIHNHTGEFDARYLDNGVVKTAWQILLERTDPRYAIAEIDAFWASDAFNDESGTAVAGLINQFPSRVKLLHIKDGVNVTTQPSPTDSRGGQPRAFGTGVVDWRPIFTAAKNRVQYYHQEQDGGTITDADISFTNMKGQNTASVPALLGLPTSFPSVAAGTAAADNALPITISNTGDKPLNITNTTLGGDNAGDFAVVGSTCGRYPGQPAGTPGVTLAPGALASGSTPAVPRGTCVVSVGFKPTKTNSNSVAYLQFTSDADDATERVLLTGTSNGNALSPVGGTVASLLSLTLGTPAGLGAFIPATARTYDAVSNATVVSTAGNATLSVSDASATATGHLVNGPFALPQALQVRANNSGNQGQAYSTLSEVAGTPTNLLTYTNPTAGADPVTLHFRQAIGASDMLRAGSYAKTLTFTLSTTTP